MKPIFVTLIGFLLVAQAMSGAYMDLLLSLPDSMLFNLAVQQKVGQCYISICPITTTSCACDLYAKVKLTATTSTGLPDLIGTGCVYAPDYPRHMSICFGPPNTYPNYNATPTPICTSSGVKNAANMIRIGIKKGHCKIPTCWHSNDQETLIYSFFFKQWTINQAWFFFLISHQLNQEKRPFSKKYELCISILLKYNRIFIQHKLRRFFQKQLSVSFICS